MEEYEISEWISKEICEEFIDEEVNSIYLMLNKFNEELLKEMMNVVSYKLCLKDIGYIKPCFVDRDTILDNIKDILLVGGSQDYSLDKYMDWDGFVQAEIDEWYEEYCGEYIRWDDLEDFYSIIREKCII